MAFPTFVLTTPQPGRNIGGITFDITREERHRDEVVIVEHPVEQGAAITDHAYVRPAEVILRVASSLSGPNADSPSYLNDLYAKLLQLKVLRAPFNIITGKRAYSNMLVRIIECTTDEHSENVLQITVWCREILIVTTQTVPFPPAQDHANPQKTAAPQNFGLQRLLPGSSFNAPPQTP